METRTISTFSDLVEESNSQNRYRGWRYRGQSDAIWPLLPKLGRSTNGLAHELDMFDSWRKSAHQYVANPSGFDEWDWLALAQHHGLATRLLDWSSSILTAAYFAVEHPRDCDAAVFCFKPFIQESVDIETAPFSVEGIRWYGFKGIAARIARQRGSFTVHGPANLDLVQYEDAGQLVKVVIPREYRERLRVILASLGIDRHTMFPDLDGLSTHLNWILGSSDFIYSEFPEGAP